MRKGFIYQARSEKIMNLINDLDGELAYAVLVEKRHTGKISSEEIVSLIKRLNDALRKISAKESPAEAVALAADQAGDSSH